MFGDNDDNGVSFDTDVSSITDNESDTDSGAFLEQDHLDSDGSSTSGNTSADTVRQADHAHNTPNEPNVLQDFFDQYQTTHKQYLINYVFTNNWGTKTETEDNLNNLETILTEVTTDMGMEPFKVNMFHGSKWILFEQLYTKYRQDIHLSEGKEIVVMKFMVEMLGLIGTTFQPQSTESTSGFSTLRF